MKTTIIRRAGGGLVVTLAMAFVHGAAFAGPLSIPTPETNKYLVIGTGEGSSGNEFAAFQMSNVEIGADQELVSNSSVGSPSQRVGSFTGGLDLTGDFVPIDGGVALPGVGNRWTDLDPDHPNDTVGIADRLPGARPIFEGIDFSGNVALTGALAKFESSNADVNANIGIQCNRSPASCFPNPSSPNSFFDQADPNNNQDLNALIGVTQFDPSNLIDELEAARDFIVGLTADTIFTSGFVNQNIKDSGAPVITDLDALDTNNDGFAVIDIDVNGQAFNVNNSDWILNSVNDTIAIFRMKDGVQYDFANSSIVLGDCDLEPDGSCATGSSDEVVDELGAIFFMDAFKGTNELFNNNNVILGGIGLWDFTDFNPNRTTLLSTGLSEFNSPVGDETVINLQDAQGCAQFISHQVLMSNNRWNRCAGAEMAQDVAEPGTLAILGLGLAALGFGRRRRAARRSNALAAG